jgi:hypothetical protein
MTCKRCRIMMYDLLDEALSASALERVRRHLRGCEKCRRFFQNEKTWAGLVRDSASLQGLHYRGGVPSIAGSEARNPAWRTKGLPPWILSARRRLSDERTSRLRYLLWGTAAGAVLVLIGLSGFLLFLPHHDKAAGIGASIRETLTDSAPRVQVISVELKGKPAKPYIYQTPKASFIWIAPSKDIGG